jgi:hypothetical protein
MQKRVHFLMIEMCNLQRAAPRAHLTIATQSTATAVFSDIFRMNPVFSGALGGWWT